MLAKRCGALRAARTAAAAAPRAPREAAAGPASPRRGVHSVTLMVADRPLTLETGRIGPLADSVVFAKYGNTSLLVSAVSSRQMGEENFMPLQVDYRERAFARGTIPTTSSRREAPSSDKETLSSRFIDRTVRPLFPEGYYYDTQLIATLLSLDPDASPDMLAIIATSAALHCSDIPWAGPAGAIVVGIDATTLAPVLAPRALAASSMRLLYAGASNRVLMLEADGKQAPEGAVVAALRAAAAAVDPILAAQDELASQISKLKRRSSLMVPSDGLAAAAHASIFVEARDAFAAARERKADRAKAQSALQWKAKKAMEDSPYASEGGRKIGIAIDSVLRGAIRAVIADAAGVSHAGAVDASPLATSDAGIAPRDTPAVRPQWGDVVDPLTGKPVAAAPSAVEAAAPQPAEGVEAPVAAAAMPAYAPSFVLFDAPGGRVDGRSTRAVRPLNGTTDFLPLVHGSAIFARGATEVFSAATLGPLDTAQMVISGSSFGGVGAVPPTPAETAEDAAAAAAADAAETVADAAESGPTDGPVLPPGMPAPVSAVEESKSFFLHYDFPPYCTNETGKLTGINRRAVGHGALAEKAVAAVMPSPEAFPYTVRVVSETSGSDGSSSMATVCSATLALMDAGVPIAAPVAGVSIGAVTTADAVGGMKAGDGYVLLTDIFGLEDHAGDMDFKVAGSTEGVTAIQLDVKPAGVPLEVLEQALWRARAGRLHILEYMRTVMAAPRPELKPTAPRVEVLLVPPELRPRLIGPGGAQLRRIETLSTAQCVLDEEVGSATGASRLFLYGSAAAINAARTLVDSAVQEHLRVTGSPLSLPVAAPLVRSSFSTLVVGVPTTLTVQKLNEFGAVLGMTRLGPEAGWLHISEFARTRTHKVSDYLSEGDEVTVQVCDVDARGRGKFSIKSLIAPGQDVKDFIRRAVKLPPVAIAASAESSATAPKVAAAVEEEPAAEAAVVDAPLTPAAATAIQTGVANSIIDLLAGMVPAPMPASGGSSASTGSLRQRVNTRVDVKVAPAPASAGFAYGTTIAGRAPLVEAAAGLVATAYAYSGPPSASSAAVSRIVTARESRQDRIVASAIARHEKRRQQGRDDKARLATDFPAERASTPLPVAVAAVDTVLSQRLDLGKHGWLLWQIEQNFAAQIVAKALGLLEWRTITSLRLLATAVDKRVHSTVPLLREHLRRTPYSLDDVAAVLGQEPSTVLDDGIPAEVGAFLRSLSAPMRALPAFGLLDRVLRITSTQLVTAFGSPQAFLWQAGSKRDLMQHVFTANAGGSAGKDGYIPFKRDANSSAKATETVAEPAGGAATAASPFSYGSREADGAEASARAVTSGPFAYVGEAGRPLQSGYAAEACAQKLLAYRIIARGEGFPGWQFVSTFTELQVALNAPSPEACLDAIDRQLKRKTVQLATEDVMSALRSKDDGQAREWWSRPDHNGRARKPVAEKLARFARNAVAEAMTEAFGGQRELVHALGPRLWLQKQVRGDLPGDAEEGRAPTVVAPTKSQPHIINATIPPPATIAARTGRKDARRGQDGPVEGANKVTAAGRASSALRGAPAKAAAGAPRSASATPPAAEKRHERGDRPRKPAPVPVPKPAKVVLDATAPLDAQPDAAPVKAAVAPAPVAVEAPAPAAEGTLPPVPARGTLVKFTVTAVTRSAGGAVSVTLNGRSMSQDGKYRRLGCTLALAGPDGRQHTGMPTPAELVEGASVHLAYLGPSVPGEPCSGMHKFMPAAHPDAAEAVSSRQVALRRRGAAKAAARGVDQEQRAALPTTRPLAASGHTPLILAAVMGRVSTVKALLAAGADIEATNVDCNTPLIVAAAKGHVLVMQALLAAGAAIEAADNFGWTALHVAASKGRLSAVEALLAAGASTTAVTHNQETALQLATAKGHHAIAALLATAP